jgi:hypothetical protein
MQQGFSTRLLAYKLTSLLVGVLCIYLGYRLFASGVYSEASLKAANGVASLTLDNAAPGIFFALFGAVVIALTIYKGLYFEAEERDSIPSAHATLVRRSLSKCMADSIEILADSRHRGKLDDRMFGTLVTNFTDVYSSAINLIEVGDVVGAVKSDIIDEDEVVSRESKVKTFGSAPQ